MKTVYFILGMHRSGTSALGGVLNIMGLDFGANLMPATEMNPKGYFENIKAFNLNEKIFNENHSSWDDCHFDVGKIPEEKRISYENEIQEMMTKEFKYSENFVIKDPRICLLFPLWEKMCQNLKIEIKIIISYRNPVEVANSLVKRDGFSFEKGLLLWSHHFLSAEIMSRSYPRIFVSFDDVLYETDSTVDKLYDFTNIETKNKKRKQINQFLDINAKHNNSSLNNFSKETPAFLQNLFKILINSDFNNDKRIDEIRRDFYYSLEMFQNSEMLKCVADQKSQKKEIHELKDTVEMLEAIKDVALLNKDYYKNAHSDLKDYDGDLEVHYYNNGRGEGRTPNPYCEKFKIDTTEIVSPTEVLYLQGQELDKKTNLNQKLLSDLEENKSNQHQFQTAMEDLQEIGQEQKEEINNLKNNTLAILEDMEKIKNIRHQVEALYENELQNNSDLKQVISETQKNLESQYLLLNEKDKLIGLLEKDHQELVGKIYDESQNLKKSLLHEKNDNKVLNKKLLKKENQNHLLHEKLDKEELKCESLKHSLNDERKSSEDLNAHIQDSLNDLSDSNKKLQNFQEINNALMASEQIKNNEISLLNIKIDEILEDLICIKESKSWIYTKPIRKINNLFKK